MAKLEFKYRVRRILVLGIAIFLLVYIPINWNRIPLWLETHTFKEGARTLDGKRISSFDEIVSGDVIVIVFWSTKCKYCHRQLTEMRNMDVEVVAINVGDSEAAVRKYVQNNNIDFIVLLGARNPPGAGLPHTQIVSKEHGLVKEWMGYVGIGEINEVLEVINEN